MLVHVSYQCVDVHTGERLSVCSAAGIRSSLYLDESHHCVETTHYVKP